MLKLNTAIYLAAGFLLLACNPDEEPEGIQNSKLIIHFDPRINNVSIQMGERLATPLNQAIEVSDLNFYLSDIALQKPNGELVQLAEVAFLKMRPSTNSPGQNWRVLEYDLPEGSYSAISFGLGVSPDLNGTQNPDFTTSLYDINHPLSESNGMYWAWESGYRFMLFEGRCDSVWQTADNLPMTFALHTGRDTLYRVLQPFPVNISSQNSPNNILNFAIDIDTIFDHEGQSIDLASERQFHGAYAQLPLGIKLANNSASAFRLLN